MFKHKHSKVILKLLLKHQCYDFLNDDFQNDEELSKIWPNMFITLKHDPSRKCFINQYKIHNKIIKILNKLVEEKYVNKQIIGLNLEGFGEFTRAKRMNNYFLSDTFHRLLESYPHILD